MKVSRNVMLVSMRRTYQLFSGEVMAQPGDDPQSQKVLQFMSRAVEVLEMTESDAEKPRPLCK